MAMPSKFTARRRQLILAALSAGASRRVASELAQIDHSTMGLWLKRGERASPGSRFAVFRAEVFAAEANPHRPQLLPLSEPRPRDVMEAWNLLKRTEFAPEEPAAGPIVVSVRFSDGSPVPQA